MEGKDDRSKAKRSKMKQHNYRKATRNTIPIGGNTSSSSAREQTVRGVVDVADSSDERFRDRRVWQRPNANGMLAQPIPIGSLEDTLDDLDNLDEEHMHAPDFNEMAQLPTSIGGHFRFSSEKNWDLQENEQLLDNMEATEYFTLNLKLLNVGLQTIPFYKRLDYPASMFTSAKINGMEKSAEAAEARYQQVLKEHNENGVAKNNSKSVDAEADATADQMSKVTLNSGDAKENLGVAAPAPPEAQDIQQWLDNVLEE